jgi:hypothetical protein
MSNQMRLAMSKTIEINVKAKVLHFREKGRERPTYIVLAEEMDYIEFMKKYPEGRKVTGVELTEGWGKFFLCFLQDCFDPPLAIVNADDEEGAIDAFVYQCEWARMSDEDAEEREKEFPDQGLVGYADHVLCYDAELMMVREVKLVGVEL